MNTTPQPPGPDAGPSSPTQFDRRSWMAVLNRTVREFQRDGLTDWAAALTYYGVLSLFPGLLVLVALLGLVDSAATGQLVRSFVDLAPSDVGRVLDPVIARLQENEHAGLIALFGLVVAFWSASGYVGAFMRAANVVYDVPEGRPLWKTLPIRIGVTAATGLLVIVSALILVFTGPLAQRVGTALGIGEAGVTLWSIAKWPVLLLLISLVFALLYWASPNARQGGFRWITPGGILAVLLWAVASGGFSLYVANFASYDKTYGTLAGAIIFLVWLWISNLAVLFGAELDAELARQRAMAVGHPVDAEPFVRLRDDRKIKADASSGD